MAGRELEYDHPFLDNYGHRKFLRILGAVEYVPYRPKHSTTTRCHPKVSLRQITIQGDHEHHYETCI